MARSLPMLLSALIRTVALTAAPDCPSSGCQQDGACPSGWFCAIDPPCTYGSCQFNNSAGSHTSIVSDKWMGTSTHRGPDRTPLLSNVGDEIGTISTLCSSSGVGSSNLFTRSFAKDSSTVGFNMACHWNVTLLSSISNDCSNPCCKVDIYPPRVYDCHCCNSLIATETANTCVSTGCGHVALHGGQCTSMCVNNVVPSAEAFKPGGACQAVTCTSYLNPPKMSNCVCGDMITK